VPDATLGGYLKEHSRPPAFEGPDGQPYTVSIEVDGEGSLRTPFCGYLIFPRWAETGLGIVGHVETPILVRGRSEKEVVDQLSAMGLQRVRDLLDDAVRLAEEVRP
jgi:hypothetical protein